MRHIAGVLLIVYKGWSWWIAFPLSIIAGAALGGYTLARRALAPVDRMAYWVLGLPGPGGEQLLEVDAAGRLLQLQQGGWQVDYIDYRVLDDGRAMPRKIEMRRDGVRISRP